MKFDDCSLDAIGTFNKKISEFQTISLLDLPTLTAHRDLYMSITTAQFFTKEARENSKSEKAKYQ